MVPASPFTHEETEITKYYKLGVLVGNLEVFKTLTKVSKIPWNISQNNLYCGNLNLVTALCCFKGKER